VGRCQSTIGKARSPAWIGPETSGQNHAVSTSSPGVSKAHVGPCKPWTGEDIHGLPRIRLFHKGCCGPFQIAHEFSSDDCRENLMMGPVDQARNRCGTHGFRTQSALQRSGTRPAAPRRTSAREFLTVEQIWPSKRRGRFGRSEKLLELGRHDGSTRENRLFLTKSVLGVNRTLVKHRSRRRLLSA